VYHSLLSCWLQEYPDIKVVKVEHDANKGLVEQYKVCRGQLGLQTALLLSGPVAFACQLGATAV
jgi:hypothetical protein